MNAKVERKERSHESILQSAARLVREKGISGAAVAEVMKGAALTVGGFYAHFSSKNELVDETLQRTGAMLRERLFARLDTKPEADRAEVILKRYLSAEHRDGGTPDCPLPAVVGEVGTLPPSGPGLVVQHGTGRPSPAARHRRRDRRGEAGHPHPHGVGDHAGWLRERQDPAAGNRLPGEAEVSRGLLRQEGRRAVRD